MWCYGTILPFLAQYAHTCSYNEPAAATIHNDIHSQYLYVYVMYIVLYNNSCMYMYLLIGWLRQKTESHLFLYFNRAYIVSTS